MAEARVVIGEAALRIAALFSYCGGPLFIADLLKPRHDTRWVFSLTFLPVGLMVMGAFYIDDDLRDRWSFRVVQAGRLGLYLALAMHLYALARFIDGVRVPDQPLHYIGLVVGAAWSVAYLRAARRWASPGDASPAADSDSPGRIEPF